MKLEVSEMIYVGDYLFDLQTAANAGMPSCLYLNEHNSHFLPLASWSFRHFDELSSMLVG